jgi:hypothetical protein
MVLEPALSRKLLSTAFELTQEKLARASSARIEHLKLVVTGCLLYKFHVLSWQ